MGSVLMKKYPKIMPWLVVITAALCFFYDFVQLNIFNVINTQVMQEFYLDAVGLGKLSSIFFYANALFLVPAGFLLDQFSTKKILLYIVALFIFGTFVFANTHHYFIAAIARFLIGLAGAFCFIGCLRLASRWFPANKMALVTGVVAAQAMLGGLVAQTPMAILNQLVGWRHAMLINAIFGVLIFLAILFIVQDHPAGKQCQIAANQSQVKNLGLFSILKQVALNPYNWLGGIYASLLNLPVFLLGALWGIHYLVQVHHLTLIQASVPTTLFFVGTIIGAPLFGWFSDYIGRRVLPLMLGAVLSIITMLVLILTPHLSFVAITALFFLIGIVICSQAVAYPTIAELNPPALTATALGFASTLIMLSGVIFQPLFGCVMEWSDFTCAMFIMPIAFGISFLIALMIKETYCSNNL